MTEKRQINENMTVNVKCFTVLLFEFTFYLMSQYCKTIFRLQNVGKLIENFPFKEPYFIK